MCICLIDDNHEEERVQKINQQPRSNEKSRVNKYDVKL